jgi:hypothetical protein
MNIRKQIVIPDGYRLLRKGEVTKGGDYYYFISKINLGSKDISKWRLDYNHYGVKINGNYGFGNADWLPRIRKIN